MFKCLKNDSLQKNLGYLSFIIILAFLFLMVYNDTYTVNNQTGFIIEKTSVSFNDSSFLNSMKAAQAARTKRPLSITVKNKNPPIIPIHFEPNMIIYNRVQKCGSRSFLKAARPMFGCYNT